MDNEIFEPLNQFDDDLKDLMIDCITEKAPALAAESVQQRRDFLFDCLRSAGSSPWTHPSTRTAGCPSA